ncbi:MAG: hypothetical protein ACXVHB_25795 [Solirubrobacteraceae bacterium]
MNDHARAILGSLDDEALDALAELLRPRLDVGDPWLGVKDAAAYAGCTAAALRHAISADELEHEQRVTGGKVWVRRSAVDRWRSGYHG